VLGVCAALSFPAEFYGGDEVVFWGAIVSAAWYVLVLYRRIKSGSAGVPVIEALTERKPRRSARVSDPVVVRIVTRF
jgi:hypothetical protein